MALGAGLLAAFRSSKSASLKRRAGSSREASEKTNPAQLAAQVQVSVPEFFLCPITYEIMADPVTLDTGMTYDRASIEEWLENGNNTCPSTNRTLLSHNLIPNVTLQRAIRAWCAENQSSGDVESVSKALDAIAKCSDVAAFYSAVRELYTAAQESGRTRRTLREEGAIVVLCQALTHLGAVIGPAEKGSSSWCKGLEYAIATIAMLHPSDDEDKQSLAVPGMVTTLASVLAMGSTTAKINAAKVIHAVLSKTPEHDSGLKTLVGNHWGAMKGLLLLIRDDGLSAKETRLGLRCLLALLSTHWNRVVAINERAVHALVELIPRAENRSVELAFANLEVLANCAEGRESITKHPFAIPRIVEFLHGVSIEATERAVGTLFPVISFASNRSVINTALQAGAFTTLLMLMPSECSPRCKSKAREMLKLLNEKYESRPGDDDFSIFIERGMYRPQQLD